MQVSAPTVNQEPTAAAPQPAKQAAAKPSGPMGGTTVPRITDVLNIVAKSSILTTDGNAYIEQLTEAVKDSGLRTIHLKTTRFESLAVANPRNKAILLVFNETYMADTDFPALVYGQEMRDLAMAQGLDPIMSLVITPADYAKVSQMSVGLINSLVGRYTDAVAALSADMFRGQHVVYIDTTMSAVNQFIANTSPHAVPGRADFGFLVSLRRKEMPSQLVGGRPEVSSEPLAAVTGYTEFVEYKDMGAGQQGGLQMAQGAFQPLVPIVHISEIITILPVENMLAMILPLAAEVFINQRLWLSPYGFTKNQPNLGNLLLDDKGKMCICDSPEDQVKLMRQSMMAPFLAIDIIDGRYRIPGIDGIANPREIVNADKTVSIGNMLIPKVCQFLGIPTPPGDLVSQQWAMLPGEVVWNNQTVDSRKVDYLNLAVHYKDPATIRDLMEKEPDPMVRVAAIRRFFEDKFTPLYYGVHMALDSRFVMQLGNALIDPRLNFPLEFKNQPRMVDRNLQNLVHSGMNVFATGHQMGQSPIMAPANLGNMYAG